MGGRLCTVFQPKFTYMIAGLHPDPSRSTIICMKESYHVSQISHSSGSQDSLRMYLSVMIFYSLLVNLTAQNLLIFIEFLSRNQLSHRVIRNYLSSLSSLAQFYGLDVSHLSHPAVSRFLRFVHQFPLQANPQGNF